ncbi:MAG: CmcI family methyltransferase [Candidatus Aminicenantales bacterium]
MRHLKQISRRIGQTTGRWFGLKKGVGHNDARVNDFIKLYHGLRIYRQTKWLGIYTWENPCDMWAIQEIITETQPDFIVETGTFKGGGAVFYASILQFVNPSGKVITVDIKPQFEEAARLKLFQERVEFIEGSSVADDVIARVAARVKGARVMVTLDSDHHMKHVLDELRLYSQFVSPGGYLIVQDTAHNGHPLRTWDGKGPMEALEEFLAENKDFEQDQSRGKFLLTFFPGGFLKRVR